MCLAPAMATSRRGLRSRTLILVSTLLLLAGTACSTASDSPAPTSGAAPAAATPTGEPRELSGPFFGFNAASIVQTVNVDLLLDAALQEQLAAFPTRLLRIPTGTAAQWIDWRTGAFIENPTSPFASIPTDRRPVTMQDWATMLERTGATAVWDLNVLNATLHDQLAMLERAEELGLSVDYIELGNELWDVRSIYPEVFPSGTDYAEQMNTWIPRLRERFPDARIAVCGADPSDAFFSSVFGPRYRDWNREVLATIRDVDAITIHPYWILPERAEPGSDVEATLEAGPDAWNAVVAETLADIPDDLAIWVTEWNQAAWGSRAGTQIWAQALSVAAVALAQVTDPRVEMSLVHDIVDGLENPHDVGISTTFPAFTNGAGPSEPLARTALGHALPLVFGAVGPDATVTRLHLDTEAGSSSPGAASGFTGVRIDGARPGAVFVNRGADPLRIDLATALPGTWKATVLTARPDAEPGWVPADVVDETTLTTEGPLEIPAYGLIRLERV